MCVGRVGLCVAPRVVAVPGSPLFLKSTTPTPHNTLNTHVHPCAVPFASFVFASLCPLSFCKPCVCNLVSRSTFGWRVLGRSRTHTHNTFCGTSEDL